ncbi:calcium-binding protein [Roseovarius sp. EL26]|uniref:calcium-binding protein n=1 Tax=Roseovarius sp. EL26 TaxID=2126672 RepID=UPI000EA0743E|nr:calcium-binding protein [Roseovarius sp. EL26]
MLANVFDYNQTTEARVAALENYIRGEGNAGFLEHLQQINEEWNADNLEVLYSDPETFELAAYTYLYDQNLHLDYLSSFPQEIQTQLAQISAQAAADGSSGGFDAYGGFFKAAAGGAILTAAGAVERGPLYGGDEWSATGKVLGVIYGANYITEAIAARNSGNDVDHLNYVAFSLFSLGEGLGLSNLFNSTDARATSISAKGVGLAYLAGSVVGLAASVVQLHGAEDDAAETAAAIAVFNNSALTIGSFLTVLGTFSKFAGVAGPLGQAATIAFTVATVVSHSNGLFDVLHSTETSDEQKIAAAADFIIQLTPLGVTGFNAAAIVEAVQANEYRKELLKYQKHEHTDPDGLEYRGDELVGDYIHGQAVLNAVPLVNIVVPFIHTFGGRSANQWTDQEVRQEYGSYENLAIQGLEARNRYQAYESLDQVKEFLTDTDFDEYVTIGTYGWDALGRDTARFFHAQEQTEALEYNRGFVNRFTETSDDVQISDRYINYPGVDFVYDDHLYQISSPNDTSDKSQYVTIANTLYAYSGRLRETRDSDGDYRTNFDVYNDVWSDIHIYDKDANTVLNIQNVGFRVETANRNEWFHDTQPSYGNDVITSTNKVYVSMGAGDDYVILPLVSSTVDGGDGIDTVSYHVYDDGLIPGYYGTRESDLSISVYGTSGSGYVVNKHGYVTVPQIAYLYADPVTDSGDKNSIQYIGIVNGGLGIGYDIQSIDRLDNVEIIRGTQNNDIFYGRSRDDIFLGDGGRDLMYGGKGNDVLRGGDEADTIYGGDGDDVLIGGDSGERNNDPSSNRYQGDRLYGERGNDLFIVNGITDIYSHSNNGGNSRLPFSYITGGTGSDTVDFSNFDHSLHIALGDSTTERYASYGNAAIVRDSIFELYDGSYGSRVNTKGRVTFEDDLEGAVGTEFDDFISGNTLDNYLSGRAGDDQIYGGAGDDLLDGGLGSDTIFGEAGDDRFKQNTVGESDELNGGDGRDTVDYSDLFDTNAESGQTNHLGVTVDLLTGLASQSSQTTATDSLINIEAVIGSRLNDHITGSNEDNLLEGGEGNDTLYGKQGDDTLLGGDGDDNLYGGKGKDWLSGGQGSDILNGRENDDVFLLELNQGSQIRDYIYGGSGFDYVDYGADSYHSDSGDSSGLQQGVDLTLNNNGSAIATRPDGGTDVINGVEGILGSQYNDSFTGDNNNNFLNGRDGDDALAGGAGSDTLIGGNGADTLHGNDGNDVLAGGKGSDGLVGHEGDDVFLMEVYQNTTTRDYVYGGDGFDVVDYGAFDTRPIGFSTSTGNLDQGISLTLNDNGSAIATRADGGTDVINGVEGILGSRHDDQFEGDAGDNYIDGRSGDDTLSGGQGNDTLIGGEGSDVFLFEGHLGKDVINDFEDGLDTLTFQSSVFADVTSVLRMAAQIGDDFVFDFGNGSELTVLNTNYLEIYNDITLV